MSLCIINNMDIFVSILLFYDEWHDILIEYSCVRDNKRIKKHQCTPAFISCQESFVIERSNYLFSVCVLCLILQSNNWHEFVIVICAHNILRLNEIVFGWLSLYVNNQY